jgi:hypothetical protein
VGLVSLIFKLQIHKPSTIIHRPIHVLHTGLVITIDVLGLVDEPILEEIAPSQGILLLTEAVVVATA